jgi:hypothetical protein
MCGPRPETLITLTRVAHQRKVRASNAEPATATEYFRTIKPAAHY